MKVYKSMQQSRFLALMENYDRLVEVQEGAMNSEDAGLVQYAKTLDSLDSKLNQLKNNFQTFYMEIFNGDFFKGALDIINNAVTNISRLGTVMGTINVLKLISQIKLIGQLLLNLMSPALVRWKTQISEAHNVFTQGWDKVGDEVGGKLYQAIKKWLEKIGVQFKEEITEGADEAQQKIENKSSSAKSSGRMTAGRIAMGVGTVVQLAGTLIPTDTTADYHASNIAQLAGGLGSVAGQLMTNNYVGAAISAVTTIAQGISYLSNYSEVMYENAKKAAEEANIERATKQSEARNLESTINNLKKLQKAQYDSEEAQQEYIDACNTAAETYPELVSSFTTSGDAIIDVVNDTTNAEYLLAEARKEAAEAAYTAAAAEGLATSRKLKNNKLYKVSLSNEGDRYVFSSQGGYNPYTMRFSDSEKQAITEETGHAFQLESLDDLNEIVSIVAKYEQLSDENKINSPLRNIYDSLSGLVQQLGFGTNDDINSNGLAAIWNKGYQDYLLDVGSLKASYQATNRAYANQYITNKDALKEADWRNLTGMESILAHSVDDLISDDYYTNGELNDTGKAAMDKVIQPLYDAVESFANGLSITKQEKWDTALEGWNKGTTSVADYLETLKKLGLDLATPSDKYKQLAFEVGKQMDEATAASIGRTEKLLGLNTGSFEYKSKIYSSIDEWNEDFLLDEDNISDYVDKMYESTGNDEKEFLKKIFLLPELYREQIANQIADLNEIINDVDKPQGQKAAAQARKELLTSFDYDLIPEELRSEFFTLLNTDMGTHEWAEKLIRFLETNGIKIDGLATQIEEGIYENITTRIQTIVDSLNSFLKNQKDYSSKQSNGWEFNEARNFISQAQEAGWTDASLDDLFEWNNEGKYVLNDYSGSMEKLFELQKGQLADLRRQQSFIAENGELFIEAWKAGRLDEALAFFGITDETLRDELVELAQKSEEEREAYYDDLKEAGKLTEQEISYIEKYQEQVERSSKFSEYSDAFSSASSFKSLLSASKLSDLESLYTTYGGTATPEQIVDYLQKSGGVIIDTFGNLTITNLNDYAAAVAALMTAGGTEIDLTQYQSIIEDALTGIFKNISDYVSAGIKGTLTGSNLQSLSGMLGEEIKKQFTLTSSGYKFTGNLSELATSFMGYGAKNGFSAYSVAEEIAEWYSELGDVADAYDEIDEAIETADSSTKAMLQTVKALLKQMSDTREFDFMNVDTFDGAADNLDKLTSSMTSAISALQSAVDGEGKLSYKNFEAMFNWMEDFGLDNDFATKLKAAGHSIEEFGTAVRTSLDYSGQVDVGSALSDMGVSFSDFSDSMGETFKQIAEEQRDYWTKQAEFFQKMADLEQVADTFEPIEIEPFVFTSEKDMEGQLQRYVDWLRQITDEKFGNGTFDTITVGIAWDVQSANDYAKALGTGSFEALDKFTSDYGVGEASLLTAADAVDTSVLDNTDALTENTEAVKALTTEIQGEDSTNSPDISEFPTTSTPPSIEAAETAKAINAQLQEAGERQIEIANKQKEVGEVISDTAVSLQTETEEVDGLTQSVSSLETVVESAKTAVDGLNLSFQTLRDSGDITKQITIRQSIQRYGPINTEFPVVDGTAEATGGIAPGGKTLVGELGPELGVYDGMYHLLGQNGAEFVNLPKQALIFNHAQTQALLKGKSGVRIGGSAMAEGNVSGPAFAGGYAAAAEKARKIAELWQGLASANVTDLLGGSGGGGGGGDDTIKATTEELEEWYNLSRRIANVEQEINNIIAERENIMEGDKYLRSLREQQVLLKEQQQLQKTLLNYQQLQLKRQADLINTNKLWSQFLTVTEEGLLQYVQGNETNGGKGALRVLQELNEMSGADQVAFLNKIGYSYTDQDGNVLEGAELVQQFFDDLQSEIDKYDELYDTVHETKETIEELETDVQEINDEILENQMDLEKEIFDTLVDAWEKQIEEMKEQNELMKQANEDYVKGLNDALTKEKDLYSQNESVAERESLQRRLSLLQRSGGSATEIANLQDEIDSMLKDEYFNSQEDMIQNIEEANDRQVELMEQQVQLQQDALDYEKEHGILWTKVYEIMSGSSDEILEFMQGNTSSFFENSMLQQEEMLTEWAKKIGIYTEDQQYKNYEARARDIFAGALSADQTHVYSRLTADEQSSIQDLFNSTFANSMLNGMSENEAIAAALAAIQGSLPTEQKTTSATSTPTTETSTSTTSGRGEFRAVYAYGTQKEAADGYNVGDRRRIQITTDTLDEQEARDAIQKWANGHHIKMNSGFKIYGFSSGGLVDYTGLAMVHGSSSKPEAFLNAEQTAQIKEALTEQGRGSILRNAISILQDIGHSVSSLVSNVSSSVSIAPGAIVINVDELNDAYDIEDVSNDIMSRITSIASRATNTSVARR